MSRVSEWEIERVWEWERLRECESDFWVWKFARFPAFVWRSDIFYSQTHSCIGDTKPLTDLWLWNPFLFWENIELERPLRMLGKRKTIPNSHFTLLSQHTRIRKWSSRPHYYSDKLILIHKKAVVFVHCLLCNSNMAAAATNRKHATWDLGPNVVSSHLKDVHFLTQLRKMSKPEVALHNLGV